MYGAYMDLGAVQEAAAGLRRAQTVLRFDSASSEYDLSRAGSSSWGVQHLLPPDCMQRHGSSIGAELLLQQHAGSADEHAMDGQQPGPPQQLLPERWDSAGPEAYGAERQGSAGQQDWLLADIVAGLRWQLQGNPAAYAGGGDAPAAQQPAPMQPPEHAQHEAGDAAMLDLERALSLERPPRPQVCACSACMHGSGALQLSKMLTLECASGYGGRASKQQHHVG